MKTDGRLVRCFLKGALGDALFAVLCGCGHIIRKILAHQRRLLGAVISIVLAVLRKQRTQGHGLAAA
ncbi:putative transposase protein [Cereibacter sphaeroides WS8N]|nr:putative transposase protein [Cereibacter sphaeroides WS8N]